MMYPFLRCPDYLDFFALITFLKFLAGHMVFRTGCVVQVYSNDISGL